MAATETTDQQRPAPNLDQIGLKYARLVMAIPSDLPGGDCQRQAKIQLLIRDALAEYIEATTQPLIKTEPQISWEQWVDENIPVVED